jgi:hypothetical protein
MCRVLWEHEKQGKYMIRFAQSTPLELASENGIRFRAQFRFRVLNLNTVVEYMVLYILLVTNIQTNKYLCAESNIAYGDVLLHGE